MSKFLRIVTWILVIAGVLIGILRLTVIRWWQVPLGDPILEASLTPTLRGGDWLILWRGTEPIQGALVLCPEPKTGRPTIARVMAEGGPRVHVGEQVLLNGHSFDTEGGCDSFSVKDPTTGQETSQACRREVLGSRPNLRGEIVSSLAKPGEADLEVPSQHFYLLSDNRQFPWDSRDFGPVERSSCVETVVFRLVSKDGFFDVPNRLTLI